MQHNGRREDTCAAQSIGKAATVPNRKALPRNSLAKWAVVPAEKYLPLATRIGRLMPTDTRQSWPTWDCLCTPIAHPLSSRKRHLFSRGQSRPTLEP